MRMRYWHLRKRKSRKQLLQEIEDLEAEVKKQQNYKIDVTLELDSVKKKIKTLKATCISKNDDEKYRDGIKECLCRQLIEEILPYASYEKYQCVDDLSLYDTKHIATIQIIEQ